MHAGPGRLGPGSGIRTQIAFAYGAAFLILGGLLLGLVHLLAGAGTRDEAEGPGGSGSSAPGAPAGRGGVVRGNRPLLAQLVNNLVANAVAYNVPGGTVAVRVAGGVLTVENTGPVIPAEDVPVLFEPFRRGEGRDRTGPGAGLGLSIVRSVAHAHDGEVTAEPGPKGGLTVTVSLPVVASADC